MYKLLKKYKCDRCGEEFLSYMTYKKGDVKICGGTGCFEAYKERKEYDKMMPKMRKINDE